MTALATGLALVPIVMGGSRNFTSTVLNLFLLPVIFLRYGGTPNLDNSVITNGGTR